MSQSLTWAQRSRALLLREVELLRLHLEQRATASGRTTPQRPAPPGPAPRRGPSSVPRPIPTEQLANPGSTLLGRPTRDAAAPSSQAGPPADQAPPTDEPDGALDLLCRLFDLDDRARSVLVLLAGVEVDDDFAELCRKLSVDGEVTVRAVLGLLPEPEWSALAPNHALRFWQLVEVGPGDSLSRSPLRIDEAVLHYLVDGRYWDPLLDGIAEGLQFESPLVPSHTTVATELARAWSSREEPTLQLIGTEADTVRGVAVEVCRLLGLVPILIRLHQIPTATADLKMLLRRADRLVRLVDAAVVLDCHAFDSTPGGDPQLEAVITQVAERLERPAILCGVERRRPAGRPLVSRELSTPTANEQAALWRALLGAPPADDPADRAPSNGAPAVPAEDHLDSVIRRLVAHFDLGSAAIVSAAAAAPTAPDESVDLAELRKSLWQSCRIQSRPRLEHLAQRIDSDADWNDLVLPPRLLSQMREIVAQVRQRDRVYRQWGMGRRGDRGLGVTALFAGQSGTGKTFSAEVMANTLALDLYRIDLSAVIDKYIGETEKNLRRIFDAAESAGAVLLFDEADALFGKRSQVQQSNDRWANIEVGYLLQRMESYRGLAILTTNLQETLDQAFLRRLRFVLDFPFPDIDQRRELWRMALPPGVPTQALDLAALSRLDLTGGQIRNAALTAAFLAAEESEDVGMRHVAAAARREYQKAGRPMSAAELRGVG